MSVLICPIKDIECRSILCDSSVGCVIERQRKAASPVTEPITYFLSWSWASSSCGTQGFGQSSMTLTQPIRSQDDLQACTQFIKGRGTQEGDELPPDAAIVILYWKRFDQ